MRRHFATTAPEIPEIFDVVCVGGGPAGLSLLTALRMTPTKSYPLYKLQLEGMLNAQACRGIELDIKSESCSH